jgi:peptidoglycan/xylan/chitin deacetylase (PgdA/CDA1 family)
MPGGALTISLDFELHWGVRDSRTVESYRANLLGARAAVPALLDLFASRGIHATWATVGFLFCRTKREIEETLPRRLPSYKESALSPYDLSAIGDDEVSDPFHYAPSLIERIARTPGQEIGTHTFSHFYCLEQGQTADDFDADLESASLAARRFGVEFRSIVFPRNQYNPDYRDVLVRRGLRAYRSPGQRWPYTAARARESWVKRGVRLADAYLPLAGHGTYRPRGEDQSGLVDVPGSAFLRPYRHRLRRLDRLRVRRINRALTHAASHSELFHLWWHPHNFGTNTRENMEMLSAVLDQFERLRRSTGMESLTMAEAGNWR